LPITKTYKRSQHEQPRDEANHWETRDTMIFVHPVFTLAHELRHRLYRPTPWLLFGVTRKSLAPQGSPRKEPQEHTHKCGTQRYEQCIRVAFGTSPRTSTRTSYKQPEVAKNNHLLLPTPPTPPSRLGGVHPPRVTRNPPAKLSTSATRCFTSNAMHYGSLNLTLIRNQTQEMSEGGLQ
jgi:hypothetical protein